MHAAKLRYEGRLLDSSGNGPRDSDLGEMLAELNIALAPDAHHPPARRTCSVPGSAGSGGRRPPEITRG